MGILIAPIFAHEISPIVRAIVVLIAFALLAGAVAYSKRSWVMERVEAEFAPAEATAPNGSSD
ncbi:MAG: hypothetical protein GDYSWBUE_000069 [Candidatus Fervidibacterota bacterium]